MLKVPHTLPEGAGEARGSKYRGVRWMGQGASQQRVWLHISVSEDLGTSPALLERAGEAGGSKYRELR